MDHRRPDMTIRVNIEDDDGTKSQSVVELFKAEKFSEQTLGDHAEKDLANLFRVRLDRSWFPQAKPVALYPPDVIIQHLFTKGFLPNVVND